MITPWFALFEVTVLVVISHCWRRVSPNTAPPQWTPCFMHVCVRLLFVTLVDSELKGSYFHQFTADCPYQAPATAPNGQKLFHAIIQWAQVLEYARRYLSWRKTPLCVSILGMMESACSNTSRLFTPSHMRVSYVTQQCNSGYVIMCRWAGMLWRGRKKRRALSPCSVEVRTVHVCGRRRAFIEIGFK